MNVGKIYFKNDINTYTQACDEYRGKRLNYFVLVQEEDRKKNFRYKYTPLVFRLFYRVPTYPLPPLLQLIFLFSFTLYLIKLIHPYY